MTFREKIDNILRINGKKFKSIQDLELAAGLGMNTLRKAYNENREPSRKVIGKLLEEIGINPEWYEGAKGEVFLKNGTQDKEPAINKNLPYNEEREILIRNIDRMGAFIEYLLQEKKEQGR